ncbi:hypothetical protein PFISCL1PPCAC_28767, partial [Pristionchus fissidentatus]
GDMERSRKAMAPRVQEKEKELVLRLFMKHTRVLIDHKAERGKNINEERTMAWDDILTSARRLLRPNTISVTRIRSICNKAMSVIRRFGNLVSRYQSMTGGGNDRDIEDQINRFHAQMSAAEADLYERYKGSPALQGNHPLADSMRLNQAVKQSYDREREMNEGQEEEDGMNGQYGNDEMANEFPS